MNESIGGGAAGVPRRIAARRPEAARHLARLAVALSVCILAQAQPQDAAAVIGGAAQTARTAKSWRAEGTLTTQKGTVHFRMAFQVPRYAKLEISDGDTPQMRLCDGDAQTTYYPALQAYVRVLLPQIGPCAFPLNAWPPMPATVQSPALGPVETVTANGRQEECQNVGGRHTWQGRDEAIRETVAVCIGKQSGEVLRYTLDHTAPEPQLTQTYAFTTLQRDVEIPAAEFEFQPPEGSRAIATIDWLTPIADTPAGVLRVSNEVSAPVLIEALPPVMPAEAALSRGGNTVALHAEVGRDGLVHSAVVARSLVMGFDEEALRCVKRWRFRPAMTLGGPAAVSVTIYIHFQ